MTKKTTYLLLILITIVIGSILQYYFCCCNCNKKEKEQTVETSLKQTPFILNDSNFSFRTTENFKFLNQNSSILLPVGDSLNLGLDTLKNYLLKYPNKLLNIKGFTKKDEKNNSMYPNLGYARAVDIKNLLVSKGYDPAKFKLEGVILDSWNMKGDTLLGPNEFKIFDKSNMDSSTEENWDLLKESLNKNPLILYFDTNQTDVALNQEERQKVTDISKYLDNVPNSTILVEGHTDNVGSRPINIELGLKRANFTKDYLIRNGINANKINTSSKGPDNPVASNDTEEGRTKNRRTIITIN